MRRSSLMLAALLALVATPAAADPVAEFYAGKQIRFIIRSGVGGSYDSYSRLLGKHIGKHIPGNPSVIPINMPGGGGIRAANYVAKIAPQDGTILTIVSQGLPVDQALGLNTSFQADLRDFHWVGNISASNQVLVTWHSSATKTFADLMTRETVIGSSQAGSISVQMPAVLNNVVGTKIRIVFGYPDGRDINLAMERGEVEGRATNPWASYISTDPHYVEKKLIVPILQMGMVKDTDLAHVPLMRDRARRRRPGHPRFHVEGGDGRTADRDHAGRAGRTRGRAAARVRPRAQGPRIHQGRAHPARRASADDRRGARAGGARSHRGTCRPSRARQGRDPPEGGKAVANQQRRCQRVTSARSAALGTRADPKRPLDRHR